MHRDAETRLQRDDRMALALILGALDKAARVALQRDGAAVEQLRPDLVQLRHLTRPQEDLRIDSRPIKSGEYASRTCAAERSTKPLSDEQQILMFNLTRMRNV